MQKPPEIEPDLTLSDDGFAPTALAATPTCVTDFIALAQTAMASKDMAAAESWWEQVLEYEPCDASHHLALGSCRYWMKKTEAAISSYRRAVALDPAFDAARISLAIAYLAADCPLLALQEAESLLHRQPSHVELRFVRASALIKLQRPREAVADLAWLHEHGGRDRDLALLECEANLALGEFELALLLCAEICEAFPTFGIALRSFRDIFTAFVRTASHSRVSDFLDGLGLSLPRATPLLDPTRPPLAPAHIDIVIPVHNGLDHLICCLDSLAAHPSRLQHKIILVDDGSAPQTRDWLRRFARRRRDIRLVRHDQAKGFSLAVAAGLSQSKSPYAVILNSDCCVGTAWLDKLYRAITACEGVAMAGPLSNNAAWQNLDQPLDDTGNYASHPMVGPTEIATIHDRLSLLKSFETIDSPLIHGFCLLLDRKIYDALGGLDLSAFSQGYGEFQDLSLRAIDAGYRLHIAADCFVAHIKGASLTSEERTARSRQARHLLYQRYTALRYLCAECCALENPPLQFTRNRYTALERYCPNQTATIDRQARLAIFGDSAADFTDRKSCLFVCYAPDGQVLPYAKHYLAALQAEGYEVVLILNVEEQADAPTPDLLSLARIVIMRENIGYDFGAWRDVLERMPQLWQSEILLFTNDSILGPFGSLAPILRRIEQSTAAHFALTESDFGQRHSQSFFWGIKGRGIKDPLLRSFFRAIRNVQSKTQAIFLYELFFRQFCERIAGLDGLCLFPLDRLTGSDSEIRTSLNPTHHLWRELMRAGFPFLKGDFCRKNARPQDAEPWLQELRSQGGDVQLAKLHVELSRLQRRLQAAS